MLTEETARILVRVAGYIMLAVMPLAFVLTCIRTPTEEAIIPMIFITVLSVLVAVFCIHTTTPEPPAKI